MPPSRRIAWSTAFAALLMAAPWSIQAQSAGTYAGLNSQGNTVEIALVDDGAGGLLVESLTMFWTADCTRSGPGRSVAWGVGSQAPVVTGPIDLEFSGNALYEKWSLVFSGNTVTGTFTGRTPEFTDIATSSRKVQRCDSGPLSFSANLTPGAAARRLAPGQWLQLR